MTARADQAAETERRILEAAAELFERRDYEAVTLQLIAENAGVTLQTVLRRFESKENLLNAAADHRLARLRKEREVPAGGSIEGIVGTLIASYEAVAEINWRMLRQEHQFATLHALANRARAFHRDWLQGTFAWLLAHADAAEQERRLTLLFAATDFYQWKLLRRDLGLSQSEVGRRITEMVEALEQSFKSR
jgi:AcrR family transcriptional regulator